MHACNPVFNGFYKIIRLSKLWNIPKNQIIGIVHIRLLYHVVFIAYENN